MWRVGALARSHHRRLPRRFFAAVWSDCDHAANTGKARHFSRRFGNEGANEEDIDIADPEKKQALNLSASDMEFYNQLDSEFDDFDDEDEDLRQQEEYRKKQEEIQKELDSRTGRPWTDPWEITEETWMSTTTHDDLPDWSPEFVSRISQERVNIHPDGIPTLSTLMTMPLPEVAPPHIGSGETKAYAAYRKRAHFEYVSEKINEMAKSRVDKILALSTWDEKQDAVDELFETLEDELRNQEEVLGKHPDFGSWVERSLHQYLKNVEPESATTESSETESSDSAENTATTVDSTVVEPVFIDCFSADDGDVMVPGILSPLKPHKRDGPGRMVEEWELSAHKKTKRIMLRQPTKKIAEILEESDSSRIFVHGRKGVGKSAVLTSIVASARRSGYVVLYLPDCDRLRKNGYFVTPNGQRKGMFDLQNLSQEICEELLGVHADDIAGMDADNEAMERYFKESQLNRIDGYDGQGMSLVDLLEHAKENKVHAPMCYSVVVDHLMNQEEKPFLMVLDEFNCFYDRGHYFHMAYDEDVNEPIPNNKINLFEHAMGAMALSASAEEEETITPTEIKRGGIIVGTSESHAVPRKITDGVRASAELQAASSDLGSKTHVIEVPRFSDIEVDHILANMEATGVGKLRLDRGDTVMDEQEVAYLKMVSGSVGQQLLDASVM